MFSAEQGMYGFGQENRSYTLEEKLWVGSSILQKADRLMAYAIETVAAIYKDMVIKKPEGYPYNLITHSSLYSCIPTVPTGMKTLMGFLLSIRLQMYMKDRMRAYYAFFHFNPNYAYWYG